ncbi:MAG: DUF5060 domain-containing protein [Bacteroidales bacterium]|nr:DUF5060 domain-containing protein [Bacteroidales bacterium]
MKRIGLLLFGIFCFSGISIFAADFDKPIIGEDVVFLEENGMVAVEAEFFFRQSADNIRRWYRMSANENPVAGEDGDPPHVANTGNNAYLEILPDTRRNHQEKLIRGENFSNTPAPPMAVLHYKVHFNTPGRYYVWVRAYSTGSEDNGIHVGINGNWPETGHRMQWCEGKQSWRWESKQRTEEVHCGEPHKIYLDVEAGTHEIMFAMREDGFEFDKWFMTLDRDFERPADAGPAVKIKQGNLPLPFPAAQGGSTSEQMKINEPELKFSNPDERLPDGTGNITISGTLRLWHKVTLTLDGPFAHELDKKPNPFTDYRMTFTFRHSSGSPTYIVPGYFAADGNAAETSADRGTKWRAHLSPDKSGNWTYEVQFARGKNAAVGGKDASPIPEFDGKQGSFKVERTNKQSPDLRAKGRLQYVGKHHLQHAGSGGFFLKAGADAPETFLAFRDFDGTYTVRRELKIWGPHVKDWREGDPVWQNGKGKGIIGAINYLAARGANVFSFLTYNAGGDGDNVWPFIERNAKLHYDCSKLDQWGIVFDHAQKLGHYLHFKMQEQENDDNRKKRESETGEIPVSLDNGDLGPERMLYCRELIARFGYLLALNWNLGEENTQSTEQQVAMINFIDSVDVFDHNIVVHTFPQWQDQVYTPLLGNKSKLTGVSLQNSWKDVHKRTLQWVAASAAAERPWIVANDEQNAAGLGVPPDPGYEGFSGDSLDYDLHDIRKQTLWGNFMAGGAGVEYYFGYKLPQNDLFCEDYRSREKSWDYCGIALKFFQNNDIPFQEMTNRNVLIGNPGNEKDKYCLAKDGELYLIYLGYVSTTELDLNNVKGTFKVKWFNPRAGGKLIDGSVKKVKGGGKVQLGQAPFDTDKDWLVVVRK